MITRLSWTNNTWCYNTKVMLQTYGLNGIDVVILIVFLVYALEGYIAGFLDALFDLFSFVVSFVVGIKLYATLGNVLVEIFSLPPGVGSAISFFLIAFVVEIVFSLVFRGALFRLLGAMLSQREETKEGNMRAAYLATINRVLGTATGMGSGVVLVTFLLTLVLTLPFSPVLKRAISDSTIGNVLVAHTQGLEKTLNGVFGQAIDETINFLTIKPQSDEFVQFNFKTTTVTVDEQAEQAMFAMVNKERRAQGQSALVFDSEMRALARSHAKDMFQRGYFSHYTPEGLSPFDRMAVADIQYQYAGENLALAPNTVLAMQGLMNSPGHRANILSENFGRVGIGIIDGGIYGEMFVQEFRD